MTASWIRQQAARGGGDAPELCSYYEHYDIEGREAEIPRGVFSLDDLKSMGRQKGWCPYFLTRHLIHHANILVYNYQYMLDPKVSNLVSKELEGDSIVVFDEAHNIDNVCIEALSVTLDKKALEASGRGISKLKTRIAEMKASDSERLAAEYQTLVRGLAEQGLVRSGPDALLASPLLPQDIMQEAVPGTIRRGEHFVNFLRKIVEYLKSQLQSQHNVEKKTPLAFLSDLFRVTALERKPLKFTYSRLNSLMQTLEITSLEDFTALQDVANFATLVATYLEGFSVVIEPQGSIVAGVTEPLLQLSCLDASLSLKPLLERFPTVVITSGTLSPLDFYPKILNFHPVVRASLPMSTFR